jgi:hypothetical protein
MTVNLMKIEASVLAALLVIGTDLIARIAVQGIERALLSTAIEWSLARIKAGVTAFPNITDWIGRSVFGE